MFSCLSLLNFINRNWIKKMSSVDWVCFCLKGFPRWRWWPRSMKPVVKLRRTCRMCTRANTWRRRWASHSVWTQLMEFHFQSKYCQRIRELQTSCWFMNWNVSLTLRWKTSVQQWGSRWTASFLSRTTVKKSTSKIMLTVWSWALWDVWSTLETTSSTKYDQ